MELNSLALLIDFATIYTKLVLVNIDTVDVTSRSQAPSTVNTAVREGRVQALALLHEDHRLFTTTPQDLGVLEGTLTLASSSAAGGLRMVVIGLVPGLTVEAANQAALGAGAKLVGSWSFKLPEQAIGE